MWVFQSHTELSLTSQCWDFKGKRSAENERTRGNNTEYIISYTYYIIYHYTCTHVRNLTSPAGHWLFWDFFSKSLDRSCAKCATQWPYGPWPERQSHWFPWQRQGTIPIFLGNVRYNNDEKKLMICSRFPNPKLAVGKRFSKWIVSPGPMCSKTIILLTATGNLGSELPSRLGMSRATSQTYHLLWSDLLTLGKKIGQFVKLVRKQNVPWEFVIPREWPSGCVWTVPLCPSIARAIWVRLKHRVPMNPEHEHFWLKTIRLGRRLLMIFNHTQVSFMWHDFLLQNQRSTTSSKALTVQDAHEHGLFPNQHKELILGQQLCYSLAVYTMAIDNPGFW